MVAMEATSTPTSTREAARHLKEWLSQEPHLPNVEDEEWLETVYRHNKCSLQKSKRKLENYFSMKTKYPNILKNRDPTSAEILEARKAYPVAYSSKRTRDNCRIMHMLWGPETGTWDMDQILKRNFMLHDVICFREDPDTVGMYCITDLSGITYQHIVKGLLGFRAVNEIMSAGYSERMKGTYYINAPHFMSSFMDILKSILPKNMAERTSILNSREEILSIFDEDVLSVDFGGNGPTFKDYEEWTQSVLEKHKSWLEEQESYCSNEALRRRGKDELEEMSGSFMKLEVD
ncbi:unnamed protein product [Bemisia tabaci]|uniref:CRAL-TRIO domain-containing protein n=1 Tax=Bemisia tabaci TaxID=7038 RepID=A0A9P0AL01_BEMTA|nr:unnamed protein product [Bemisia tabaci]